MTAGRVIRLVAAFLLSAVLVGIGQMLIRLDMFVSNVGGTLLIITAWEIWPRPLICRANGVP